MHEASKYVDNSFITLTYNPENLPQDRSLHHKHFQKFMKRLRKANPHQTIRFYMCGEYGTQLSRPHYHAILFNCDFYDKELHQIKDGISLYKSEQLEQLWGKGFCTIGEVTEQTAGYVARYCTKKITGSRADEHYYTCDEYGELHDNLQPEYSTMSTGGSDRGIGFTWIRDYITDVYPHDELITMRKGEARSNKPPRYYDKIYKEINPQGFEALKNKRKTQQIENAHENTRDRLRIKEFVKTQQIKPLQRNYENETWNDGSIWLSG